jgi:uracil-DNA glycosylase family 4
VKVTTEEKQAKLDEIAAAIIGREVNIDIAKSCLNPVPGEGNPDAEVMLVGEAPGGQEDKLGQPFVGASGKFLTEMLTSINLRRDDVFITSIVKFRPPENRDPSEEEIKACLPYLLAQIKVIQPKLIVFLGRYSMNVFFPELKISQAHGNVFRRQGQVFLPLYHPAAALYNGSMRQILLEDFAKIPTILEKLKQN